MLTRKRITGKLALAAAAALAVPLLGPAPSASADDTRWSVTVGSGGGHYDRGRSGRHYVDRGPSGYYRSVWVPAVYRTRYDDCGRPIRVCVRAGYYARVWVSTAPRYERRYVHRRQNDCDPGSYQWGSRRHRDRGRH